MLVPVTLHIKRVTKIVRDYFDIPPVTMATAGITDDFLLSVSRAAICVSAVIGIPSISYVIFFFKHVSEYPT